MKKMIAVISAALLAACGGGGGDDDSAASVNTGSGSSTGSGSGSGSTGSASNGLPGVSSVADDRASEALPASDFMRSGYQEGTGEILLSQLALERATNEQVKRFAQLMIDHHTRANAEIQALASDRGISLPSEAGSDHQTRYTQLQALSGSDFDRAYMNYNVAVHDAEVGQYVNMLIAAGQQDGTGSAGTSSGSGSTGTGASGAGTGATGSGTGTTGTGTTGSGTTGTGATGTGTTDTGTSGTGSTGTGATGTGTTGTGTTGTGTTGTGTGTTGTGTTGTGTTGTGTTGTGTTGTGTTGTGTTGTGTTDTGTGATGTGATGSGATGSSGTAAPVGTIDLALATYLVKMKAILSQHLGMAKEINGEINPSAWLVNTYRDGLAEIALSNLALQRAQSAEVRSYAQMLVDEHTRANNEVRQVAQAKGVTLPDTPTNENRSALEELEELEGAVFDKAYMNHNVIVHALSVRQTRVQASGAGDSDVQALAARTLPDLEEHFADATRIYQALPNDLLLGAWSDGLGEILLSTLAVQRATDSGVKQYAQDMINDHTNANTVIANLADARDRFLPVEPSAETALAFMDIAPLTGAEFDRAYMDTNVAVHQKAVALFTDRAQNETDDALRTFAAQTLPVLTEHLQEATALRDRVGAGSGGTGAGSTGAGTGTTGTGTGGTGAAGTDTGTTGTGTTGAGTGATGSGTGTTGTGSGTTGTGTADAGSGATGSGTTGTTPTSTATSASTAS